MQFGAMHRKYRVQTAKIAQHGDGSDEHEGVGSARRSDRIRRRSTRPTPQA
jgi:hypothetical protein